MGIFTEIPPGYELITIAELLVYKAAMKKLRSLEEAGVDNWDGYDYAMELMEDRD